MPSSETYKVFIDPEYPPELRAQLEACIKRAHESSNEPRPLEYVQDSADADCLLDASRRPGQRYVKAASNPAGPYAGTTYALSFRKGMGGNAA